MMARTLLKAVSLLTCAGLLAPATAHAAEGDTTTVYITGFLVDAPECTVNGNNRVDVDFGDDVITYQVDGQNYTKEIEYTLSCNDVAQNGLTMTLNGTPAGFNSALFKTDNDGLGIRITSDGKDVLPGRAVQFDYNKQPTLRAVPVARNAATLDTGPFEGSATMVIAYQ